MSASSLPSLESRLAVGRAYRARTPRRALAPLGERPASYDVVERLAWQGERRIAGLLALRYQRMLESPFSFLRGSALVMADDLARGSSTSLDVQICGDAHAANFGIFSSPEGRLVFDVNDFDETDEGPFEWDVKRLVTSLVVIAAQRGYGEDQQRRVATETVREYQHSILRFAHETRLKVWYAALDVQTIVQDLSGFFDSDDLGDVDAVIGRAHSKETPKAFDQLITATDEGPRISARPPLRTPLRDVVDGSLLTRPHLDAILAAYGRTLSSDRQRLLEQFTPVDAAHQVVGVGSVGTQCFIVLLLGRDDADPFFLQVKEASDSVVSIARGTTEVVANGERVVRGQKLMQTTPDLFLGWHSMAVNGAESSFYVRQLYDHRASVALDRLDDDQLMAYGRVCAWVLARAHARSGRGGEIAGYLGTGDGFARALSTFALAYRDRNLADFQALRSAVEEGRVAVAP